MKVRSAEKAGSWYSADPASLRRELDGYLNAAGAQAAAPIRGAIVPHAGLAFSGLTAARVFRRIQASSPEVQVFIVFGAVHTMALSRPAIWRSGIWQTPLGDIAVDEELAGRLIEAGVGGEDPRPHCGDNAIELQTPFLRHCFPEARIVPVAVPPAETAAEAGRAAWDVVSRLGMEVIALGSTDLTHYGLSFGLAPAGFGPEALAWGRQNDRRLLALMEEMRAEDIVPQARKDRSACGAGAAAATVAYARAAGCGKGEVLEHTTSYDVRPDGQPSHFVGYGAVVFAE